jgi:hypothetical protein
MRVVTRVCGASSEATPLRGFNARRHHRSPPPLVMVVVAVVTSIPSV